jgi:[ribosomal protein S18]-alanine N-acetyltransferase
MMSLQDLAEVLQIEQNSFAKPWPYEAFYHEVMNNPYAFYSVIEVGGKVVGYCGLWVVHGSATITNIAIIPTYRRKGLGQSLLSHAINVAKKNDADSLSLEVRVSNYVAKGLYKKLGFQVGGIRKGYYSDNNEDALVMWIDF